MIELLTPENISKVIAILISIITLFTTLKKIISKKETLKIDYEFAEKFIAEERWKNMHDFLLEKAYFALSGKQIEASIIRFFFEKKDPSFKLNDYHLGSRFLKPIKENDTLIRISLIEKYVNEQKFKWAQRKQIGLYFLTAFMAIFPLILFPNLLEYDISLILIILLWVLSFGALAFLSLQTSSALEAAKRINDL